MNYKVFINILSLLFFTLLLWAGGGGEVDLPDEDSAGMQKADLGARPESTPQKTAFNSQEGLYQPGPREILTALTEVYPNRVGNLRFIEGNWSVEVNGTRFYWMSGRMLSEENREDWMRYSAYYFRSYTGQKPPVRQYTPEEEKRIREWINRREKRKIGLHTGYMNSLWGMESLDAAELTVEKIRFLGLNIRVHPFVVSAFNAVEKDILNAKQEDKLVQSWLETIDYYGAYYWRKIAGSPDRSMHSYGLAIDFIPVNYNKKYAYWRWASDLVEKWWEIPHEQRYGVPKAVIKAFERHGFIWGGNWVLFDQIHFEYRPELILLGKRMENR